MPASTIPDRARRCRPGVIPCLAAALLAAAAGIARAEDFIYVVRPGDNPWNLTERYLKSIDYWPRLQDYNRILTPETIRPGTTLRIPVAWMRGTPDAARIAHVAGRAEVERDGAVSPLRPGMTLVAGTVIRTAGDSSLTIEFPDGSRSLVGADTELRLADLKRLHASGAQQTQLELRHGDLENDVRSKRLRGGRFIIDTPAATAAVRGTRYRVHASGDTVRTETLRGEVALANRRGEAVVRAGRGSLARSGGAPLRPTTLLPAPQLETLPERIDRLPLALDFAPVSGATAYRTQLASTPDFGSIESDRHSPLPRANSSGTLPDGLYRLRVRAIDANGLEGVDAEREITVDARPEPPFPIAPAPDARVDDDAPAFSWAHSGEAARYRFQLADDPSFKSPLVDAGSLAQPGHALAQPLAPGRYWWRIAVTTPDEGAGPFSDPQRFDRPPPGPTPEPPAVDGDRLTLRWRASGPDDRYQVQIATTPSFEQTEHDGETTEPAVAVPRPAAGMHYVRVRSLSPGETPGPWGKPQQIEIPNDNWRALLIVVPALLLAL